MVICFVYDLKKNVYIFLGRYKKLSSCAKKKSPLKIFSGQMSTFTKFRGYITHTLVKNHLYTTKIKAKNQKFFCKFIKFTKIPSAHFSSDFHNFWTKLCGRALALWK
ncbi:unnamed protein product [Meganyctiphanes norvegica]|uniref:Uncharacterized protein n=1 Tax=Meganyctiphanes norvegica TaxID=48144 RepID=A0AAV2SAU1_MEGNR